MEQDRPVNIIGFTIKLKRAVFRSAASCALLPSFLRARALKAAGAEIAEKVTIISGSTFMHPETLSVGRNTYIGGGCVFEGDGSITLGKLCFVADNVVFLTSELVTVSNSRGPGTPMSRSIEVCHGTWIYADTVIYPGVKIGPACSVDKGSVVTTSFGGGLRIGGNPAVEIKPIEVPSVIAPSRCSQNTLVAQS